MAEDHAAMGAAIATSRVNMRETKAKMAGAAAASATRIPGIDGLRAVAILLVMVSHAGLGNIVPGGFGVTVFFFLSGYLITTLLRLEQQRTGRIDLRAFYARRAARILPPLYLTLILTIILAGSGLIAVDLLPVSLLLDVAFLTNYAGLFGVRATTPIPLWSLDVEEHFYIIFPTLFILMSTTRMKRPVIFLACICAAVLLVRFVTFPTPNQPNIYYWSHTRIDSIVFGAILALWQNPVLDRNAWRPRLYHVALALGAILASFVLREPFFRETLRYSVQGAALFVLFSAIIQSRGIVADIMNSRPLRVIALLSYTLYLVHFPLLSLTSGLPMVWSVSLAYALAFAWAGLLYTTVERPLARWRKRSLERAVQGGKAGRPA